MSANHQPAKSLSQKKLKQISAMYRKLPVHELRCNVVWLIEQSLRQVDKIEELQGIIDGVRKPYQQWIRGEITPADALGKMQDSKALEQEK